MNTKVLTILLLSVALLVPASAQATPVAWTIDSAHSEIGFSVRHLGVSNVKGRFREFTGKIQADAETGRLLSVEGTVQAGSIDTGIGKRDDHLRSDDFFNAAEHPTLTLKADSFKWNGDRFTTLADLTIRGNTHPVEFTGELIGVQKTNFGAKQLRAGYSATAKIDRKKFGLKFGAVTEGVSVVADEVKIHIEIEAYRPLE